MIWCSTSWLALVEVAALLGLWGEAILVGHHLNVHHYHNRYIVIGVLDIPHFQVGAEGLAEVVGRWGAEGEQEMLQMTKERDGEDKGVGLVQEEGLWQEAVEGL